MAAGTTAALSAIERRRDAAAAGHAGNATGARMHLNDDDPMVRCSALRGLERAGGLGTSDLEAGLEDLAPAVRITALELAVGRSDLSVATLTARLDDGDHRVVEAAAWACGEKVSATDGGEGDTGDSDAAESAIATCHTGEGDGYITAVVAALARLAGAHEDPLCRESAVAALGAIAHPAGLPAILAGLGDKPEIRRRAVIALAPFDGPEVDAALLKATTDRDKQVRTAATELRGC